MKIVVDFRLEKNFSPAMAAFLEQLWVDLANFQPESQFCLLTNTDVIHGAIPANMIAVNSKPGFVSILKQKRTVTQVRQFDADRFITLQADGMNIITATNSGFQRKDLLKKSTRIQFYKTDAKAAHNDDVQVKIVRPAFEPLSELPSWAEAESLKTRYSGGRDFFLFAGGDLDSSYELIELLRAFSIFKKWQQSNMQLLMAGFPVAWTTAFEEKLSTYKYRDDVSLLKDTSFNEMSKLAAIAYAILCPGIKDVNPLPLVLAIQGAAAIIASDIEIHRQFTNTATWIDNGNLAEGFGNAMILLYKDENQKQLLTRQLKIESATYNRGEFLQQVWQHVSTGHR